MDEWNPHVVITRPADCRSNFNGIAFDGCFFYFTAPKECCIYKCKRDFTLTDRIKTDKPYCCICYDDRENCFWATENKHKDIIYKLDYKMIESSLLQVINCPKTCSPIMGLSYNCEKNTLLAAYKDRIINVSKETGHACILREVCEESYAAVLSIAPFYAIVRQEEKSQRFQILTREGRSIKNFCIPAFYNVNDILFYPCNQRGHDKLEFLLLATKDDGCENVLIKVNICDMVLCDCNYKVCRTHCSEEDENEHCISDVIESVALVETALSHILNAEGEKLQKAVELANNIDELIAVNRSVTKAIITITQLEYQLYLKLDALNDLCKAPA